MDTLLWPLASGRGHPAAAKQLDDLLERACTIAQEIHGPERVTDPFRGLHISPEEVAQLLDAPPAASLLPSGSINVSCNAGSEAAFFYPDTYRLTEHTKGPLQPT